MSDNFKFVSAAEPGFVKGVGAKPMLMWQIQDLLRCCPSPQKSHLVGGGGGGGGGGGRGGGTPTCFFLRKKLGGHLHYGVGVQLAYMTDLCGEQQKSKKCWKKGAQNCMGKELWNHHFEMKD